MHKAKLKYALALALLVGVCATAALLYGSKRSTQRGGSSPTHNPPSADVADSKWEAFFFSELEKRTSQVNLTRLKGLDFTDDHLEVRYWYNASPDVINGFVIRRLNNNWSALGIRQTRDRWPSPIKQEDLGTPRSGWDTLWKQLTDAGMLVLPNSNQTKCYGQTLDGVGVVIEVLSNKTYRTYQYSNPSLVRCTEAKQIVLIDKIISEEFNLITPEV
ncbi:MAG: hypothetical protein LC794_07435 [Acidobacteria bacterium]|nr:hypothetical protein [Acidobacteriota bacterium]